jgi:Tol biopolymer transport system component/DNA-binding winged helix-turn-helix (wHTH) protein
MSLPIKHFLEFGQFRIDPIERVLFRNGRPVPLPPKSFETLVALVEKSGHIVEKNELMDKVWPDTFVEEVNLARHISNLRKVLGDGDEDQPYIETVPRRGYRFVADVRTVPIDNSEGVQLVTERQSPSHIITSDESIDSEAREARLGPGESLPARSELNRSSAVGSRLSDIKNLKRLVAVALAALAIGVIVISAVLYHRFSRNPPKISNSVAKSVPFTTYLGTESEPVFSPDGSRIAFVWNSEKRDNFDIYVQLINAGTPFRLTSNPEPDLAPAWSPDGSHIAFTRVSGAEKIILLIPAMGGTERKLHSIVSDEPWLAARLSWSRDGKLLAFSGKDSPQHRASILLLSIDTLEKRLMQTPPEGHQDTNPIFSPDGERLAFIRRHGSSNREIYVVPVTGGEPRRLTHDNRIVDSLAWTPASGEIIFTSNRTSTHRLWRISANGGEPEQISVGGDNIHDVAISRQGNRLAFIQSLSDLNIWRWEKSGTGGKYTFPTKLIASTRADTSPQYSPDGKKIVFISDRTGSSEVWVCDSEGMNLIRLTNFGGPLVGSPRWSPDSRRIAFDCTAEGPRDIYVMNAEGGPAHRVTTETSEEIRPSWSQDGGWLYFSSNRTGEWQVWKAPLAGGPALQVTKKGGYEAFESADARFVYYSLGRRIPGIWRVPSSGGEEVRVIERASEGNWSLLDHGIYFLTPTVNRSTAVELFSFSTEQIRQISEIEMEMSFQGPSLSASRDGRWILTSRLDHGGSDIMLVDDFK